jgi:hypothetical protein
LGTRRAVLVGLEAIIASCGFVVLSPSKGGVRQRKLPYGSHLKTILPMSTKWPNSTSAAKKISDAFLTRHAMIFARSIGGIPGLIFQKPLDFSNIISYNLVYIHKGNTECRI